MSAVLEAQEPSARYLEAVQPALLRQFELLAVAPGGVARLRELVLVLAVQGKLTRRDALAEPAPALLARILKQKESLIAAGKMKRDKPLPAIDEADRPFDIPQSWCWVRLGGITNYGSPTKGGSIGPETWVLDLEDIEKSTGRLLHRVRHSERSSLSEKNSFQAGDVLYGKLRPYLNKVIVAGEPGVCTTELVPFRCYGDWVPQYFKTALSSPPFLEYVNARSYGMKMPRLGTEDARTALLPLPPLEEQARIVARVDELMRLCDALEAKGRLEAEQHGRLLGTLLGTLTDSSTPEELAANWQRVADHFDLLLDRPEAVDALEQTILQLAVRGLLVRQDPRDETASILLDRVRGHSAGRKVSRGSSRDGTTVSSDDGDLKLNVPPSWEEVQLSELCTVVTDGEHATPERCDDPTQVPLVTAKNVRSESMDYMRTDFVPRQVAERCWRRCKPQKGDVLMVSVGATLGRLCILKDPVEMVLVRSVTLLRPAAGAVDVNYLALHLMSPKTQSEIWASVKQSAQPCLYLAKSAALRIALPPLREQERIVARVFELRRLCTDLRQRLTASLSAQSHLAEALVAEVV